MPVKTFKFKVTSLDFQEFKPQTYSVYSDIKREKAESSHINKDVICKFSDILLEKQFKQSKCPSQFYYTNCLFYATKCLKPKLAMV